MIEINQEQLFHKLKNTPLRSNTYVCKLAILDHIHECIAKDTHLKAIDAPKYSEWYQALDKELMDLKILLDMYFYNKTVLYQQRIEKFIQHLNKNMQSSDIK